MAETRSPDELVDAVVALQAKVADLESTLTVRVAGRPTGTIEPTFELNQKSGTLFLNGQSVSRTTFAVLWQWVQDNNLLIAGGFTSGDGSTTFGLPNMSGRVLTGAGTLSPNTYAVGSTGGTASLTLTTANLPAHDHGGVGDHQHAVHRPGNGNTNATNAHNDHFPDYGFDIMTNGAAGGAISGNLARQPGGGGRNSIGAHNHTIDPGDSDGGHTHTSVGQGVGVNIQQPYIAVNFWVYV